MADDERILAEINDNLSYRGYTKKIEDLKREKEDKVEALNSLPSKQELSKMFENKRREHAEKNNAVAELVGKLGQLQEQVHSPMSQM